jgi:hypothetical protein
MADLPEELRSDVKELRQGVSALTVEVARMGERTSRVEAIDTRLRAVEDRLAHVSGLGKAGAQGVSWVLPIALAVVSVLVSALTWALTHR